MIAEAHAGDDDVDSTAMTGAALFGDLGTESGYPPVPGLRDAADDYASSPEPTDAQLREAVESPLHDDVLDFFFEHHDDYEIWNDCWKAVDVDELVRYIRSLRQVS